MLNYKEFKKEITELIKQNISEDMTAETLTVSKNNGELDAITVGKKGTRVSPTIYINDMYDEYMSTEGDMQETLEGVLENLNKAIEQASVYEGALEEAMEAKNIIFQLVNTEMNKDRLQNIPHREYLDLSIVYRLVVSMEGHGISSSIINNDLAKKLELTEEDLYQIAIENTEQELPPVIKDMAEVLSGFIDEDDSMPMLVVSNIRGINGAGVILYENTLSDLAERIGTDFYIFPSSIHEVIALSAEEEGLEHFKNMVYEINRMVVSNDERLSDTVYLYKKDTKELVIA